MALLITEPDAGPPDLPDWQNIIAKLTKTTGGLQLLDYYVDSVSGDFKIKKGSRFEINGSFYAVGNTEDSIEDLGLVENARQFFVYAVPEVGGAKFIASHTVPRFDVEKGGFFDKTNLNMRALYWGIKENNAIIIDPLTSVADILYDKLPSTEYDEVAVENTTGNQSKTFLLLPGWYRLTCRGGDGANGGVAFHSPATNSTLYPPGTGTASAAITVIFYNSRSQRVILASGSNGTNGGNANSSQAGAAGANGDSPLLLFKPGGLTAAERNTQYNTKAGGGAGGNGASSGLLMLDTDQCFFMSGGGGSAGGSVRFYYTYSISNDGSPPTVYIQEAQAMGGSVSSRLANMNPAYIKFKNTSSYKTSLAGQYSVIGGLGRVEDPIDYRGMTIAVGNPANVPGMASLFKLVDK